MTDPQVKLSIDPDSGHITFDLSDYPQEVIDYALDQYGDRFLAKELELYPGSDDITKDYEKGTLTTMSLEVELMQKIVDEKIADMNSKSERAEREDEDAV